MSIAVNRLCLNNNILGWKRQWKFTKKTGAYVQDCKGGIDYWRYGILILKLLLVVFTLKYNRKQVFEELLSMMVQDDKALSHNSRYQVEVFSMHNFIYLL